MAKVDDEVEFGGATTLQMRTAARAESDRLRGLKPEVKMTSRALETAHLINMLMAWYLSQGPQKREEIARRGLELYLAHKAGAAIQVGSSDILEGGSSPKSRPSASRAPVPNLRRKGRKSECVDARSDKAE
jgi:hypothetical protein